MFKPNRYAVLLMALGTRLVRKVNISLIKWNKKTGFHRISRLLLFPDNEMLARRSGEPGRNCLP